MDDPFALLGLPRRPWLEEGAVRAAFHQRAREWHPDAPGGDVEKFSALNAAQAALSDPATRLQMLSGHSPSPAMPADPGLGFRVGNAIREADSITGRLSSARNSLDRALLAPEASRSKKSLENLGLEIAEALERAVAAARTLDAAWPDVEPEQLARLGAEFRFLRRWRAQLRERALALSL